MPVREMLKRIDARELTEWLAYEEIYGPIGTTYQDEALAAIHEKLQELLHATGAAHLTPKGKENPFSKPEHYPRPSELAAHVRKQQEGD